MAHEEAFLKCRIMLLKLYCHLGYMKSGYILLIRETNKKVLS